MELLTLHPTADAPALQAATAKVYVDGLRRRDLHVTEWELLPAPEFDRCTVALGSFARGELDRMESIGRLPRIGSRISILNESVGGEFHGIVVRHCVQSSPQGETLAAEAHHELEALLSPTISTLYQQGPDGAVELARSTVTFNDGQAGLCAAGATTYRGRQARLFDASASARPWTVADALAYLLATAVPQGVAVPASTELQALAGQIDLGVLNVSGMTVSQAMLEVARRGGVMFRPARAGLGLVFYRPGLEGQRRRVGLQPPGQHLSIGKSNLCAAAVTFNRRPPRPGVLALGRLKRYECTLALQPGWDPSQATTRWRDCVRSMSSDWPRLTDVYRKWVLNEHGWYSQAPWSLPTRRLTDISGADFPLSVPRHLLPCLSAKKGNESHGVVVEVSTDSGATWRLWRGPLWISRDECAVYLGGDALPGEFFTAAVDSHAAVRATATVEAEVRLTAQIDGDSGCGLTVLNLSASAGWARVHPSSIFYGRSDLGTPHERDDSLLLQRLARRHVETAALGAEAQLQLGWLDTSFGVGDVIQSIDGRGLELASSSDALPSIVRVRHDFVSQTTELLVRG